MSDCLCGCKSRFSREIISLVFAYSRNSLLQLAIKEVKVCCISDCLVVISFYCIFISVRTQICIIIPDLPSSFLHALWFSTES